MTEPPRILCVDDEPQILQGLTLHLKRHFKVVTADSGSSALELMAEHGAPAVILSDMTMPVMDGAALLKRVRQLYPETARILLTGETSRQTAAAAVNEGQVFRFLTKPCNPDELRMAVDAGVGQHRLLTAEKVLMQETLIGCINALIDVLAMTNPVAFGRSSRVKRMAMELAFALGQPSFWQLEAAAMLSQIGYISLPVELVEKLHYGKRLTEEERILAARAPEVAGSLLARIPRIETVTSILTESQKTGSDCNAIGLVRLGADILRVTLAYDASIAAGNSSATALHGLKETGGGAGQAMLIEKLSDLIGASAEHQEIRELRIDSVLPGMIIQEDLRTLVGTLLVPKGFEVTDAFLQRTRNFESNIRQTKIRVLAPTAASQRHDSAK